MRLIILTGAVALLLAVIGFALSLKSMFDAAVAAQQEEEQVCLDYLIILVIFLTGISFDRGLLLALLELMS